MHIMTALRSRLAALQMGLHKSPSQIGRRGTVSPGKRLHLAEDSFWKFNGGLQQSLTHVSSLEGTTDQVADLHVGASMRPGRVNRTPQFRARAARI